jgi:hypothetical protein
VGLGCQRLVVYWFGREKNWAAAELAAGPNWCPTACFHIFFSDSFSFSVFFFLFYFLI